MIRRVGQSDENAAPTLQQLDAATRPRPWSIAQWEAELAHSDAYIWVAQGADDTWEGFLVLRVSADVGELLQIAVHPSARRRGLARRMLDHARHATTGASEIWLEVRASNTAAIALYRQAGFSTTGRRPRYYADPVEDALLLSLSCAGPSFEPRP